MSSYSDAIDARDLSNLAHVRDLYASTDPVPAGLTDRLKYAISVHVLHADVAELVESVQLATRTTEARRAEPTPTESVTFTAASVSLMVSMSRTPDDAGVRIDGWVTCGGAEIDVVSSDATTTVTSDEHGRFVFEDVARGPIHFIIRTHPGDLRVRPVITPTMEV